MANDPTRDPSSGESAEQRKIRELERERELLRQEVDFLKKAAAHFDRLDNASAGE